MIIPPHYRITVDITVINQIFVLQRVQIVRFTYYYIATWRNHSEHASSGTTSSRTAADVDSISTNQLKHRTRPLILPIVSLEVVLRLRTCQTIISTICIGHWLPRYALRLLCSSGMQGKSKIPTLGCSFPMQV
jgi:hypothetical protein